MRKLRYLFTVPQGEKVTEKHFRRVLISYVCSILLTMSCLFSTTWALFQHSVVSADNVIQMGTFEPVILVQQENQPDITIPLAEKNEIVFCPGTYELNILDYDVKQDRLTVSFATTGETTAKVQIIAGEQTMEFAGGSYSVSIQNRGTSRGYLIGRILDPAFNIPMYSPNLYPENWTNTGSMAESTQVEETVPDLDNLTGRYFRVTLSENLTAELHTRWGETSSTNLSLTDMMLFMVKNMNVVTEVTPQEPQEPAVTETEEDPESSTEDQTNQEETDQSEAQQ